MTAYWEQYEPSLESMMLSADAAKLDLAEKEEILSYLPAIKGKTVLELGSGIGYVGHYYLIIIHNLHHHILDLLKNLPFHVR